MKRTIKYIILFFLGGIIYCLFEIAFRGYTHWTMGVLGGVCFLLIGELNEHYFNWDTPLLEQGIIGACIVTSLEFVSGIVLNIYLNLNIWDYSNMSFNLLGQICLPFSLLWILISMLAVVIDDWSRYLLDKISNYLFGNEMKEERPHYKLW